MDIQDQIEEAIEQFETMAKLEEDVTEFDETVDLWSRQTIHELTASLDDSSKLEQTITGLGDSMRMNDERLKNFIKILNKDETLKPTAQANKENLIMASKEIERKLAKVQTAHEKAVLRLENFEAERDRLLSYVKELETWITKKENTLLTIEKTHRIENIVKCKEVNVELLTQRENIEQTKDYLNGLCRKYHASDKIEQITESVTNLVKKYEGICRLSVRVLNQLESTLTEQYTAALEKILVWKKHASEVISNSQDVTGKSCLTLKMNRY
jgi:DNA repair exonuclease SbcCD ATPase subunit